MKTLARLICSSLFVLFGVTFSGTLLVMTGCVINLGSVSHSSFGINGAIHVLARLHPTPDGTEVGTWEGNGSWSNRSILKRSVAMEIVSHDVNSGSESTMLTTIPVASFYGLPLLNAGNQELEFGLQKDAGSLVFKGSRSGSEGSGTIHFAEDAQYAASVHNLTGEQPSTSQLLDLYLTNVRLSYIEDLSSLPYSFSIDEIIRFKNQGINRPWLEALIAAQAGMPTVDEALELRRHGVGTEYLQALATLNMTFSADDIKVMKKNGLSVEQIRAYLETPGPMFSIDDMIHLRRFGVDGEYANAMREAGYITADDIVHLNRHGVTERYVEALRECNYQLNVAEVTEMFRHGVSADYVREVYDPALPNVPAEDLIEARRRGLSPDFVRRLRAPAETP